MIFGLNKKKPGGCLAYKESILFINLSNWNLW